MNVSQSVIGFFMTGILFVLLSIAITALNEQISKVENIKYLVILCVLIIWTQIIFVGDLYITSQKTKDELKNFQKIHHESIMKKYTDGLVAESS